jgi:hypothetical protein
MAYIRSLLEKSPELDTMGWVILHYAVSWKHQSLYVVYRGIK